MPRTHKRTLGSRSYRNYTQEMLEDALKELREGHGFTAVSLKYRIPLGTLFNKVKNLHNKKNGGQTLFSNSEEIGLVKLIQVCGEWGSPLDSFDVRLIAKKMLEKSGRRLNSFEGAAPGNDWVIGFLKRHAVELKTRKAENINRSRAEKTDEEIISYFENLKRTLENVPKENIINFDETNLTDDPGKKKYLFKRSCKYPERVQNFTKGAFSLMFSGSASGELPPLYVIYKSDHLWDTWCNGGPPKTRYNRTKSGWFDGESFHDWFMKIALPYCKRLSGPKVIIGDNLSSHFNLDIIKACEESDIRFVTLPENSTHLTQPLDVAFFAPLKKKWRSILNNFKATHPKIASLPKNYFPSLLKELMEAISVTSKDNLQAGFKATGIFPFNPNAVLKRLPGKSNTQIVSESVLEYPKGQ